jgi:hypothetical protein
MKNIHILPTNKPSKKGDVVIWNGLKIWDGVGVQPHHNLNIYITSDEEIKEGDWCLFDRFPKVVSKASSNMSSNGSAKKIILTTDQDLINDGVQAIDDEFLEWFVKNSSCEFVEVKIDSYIDKDISESKVFVDYKIIIPKEEPKSIIEKMKSLQKQWQKDMEETLEKAAENHAKYNFDSLSVDIETSFISGAKWQAERMYSEEDMINASKYGYNFHKTTLFPNQEFEDSCINNTKQWLTIFKK